MPLNKRPVSSFPPIGGDRVGVGSGVGEVDVGASRGGKNCKRSSETQRYNITAKIAVANRTTTVRNMRRLDFGTRLLLQPGDQRNDDPDHAQDRHQSGRHERTRAHEFRSEIDQQEK